VIEGIGSSRGRVDIPCHDGRVPRHSPIMVLGTSSVAGKSLLTAALCASLSRRGLRVAPFKAQNMSNNARVVHGGEIGVAQWLQARAAGVEPSVDHNPVLLKPEADTLDTDSSATRARAVTRRATLGASHDGAVTPGVVRARHEHVARTRPPHSRSLQPWFRLCARDSAPQPQELLNTAFPPSISNRSEPADPGRSAKTWTTPHWCRNRARDLRTTRGFVGGAIGERHRDGRVGAKSG